MPLHALETEQLPREINKYVAAGTVRRHMRDKRKEERKGQKIRREERRRREHRVGVGA